MTLEWQSSEFEARVDFVCRQSAGNFLINSVHCSLDSLSFSLLKNKKCKFHESHDTSKTQRSSCVCDVEFFHRHEDEKKWRKPKWIFNLVLLSLNSFPSYITKTRKYYLVASAKKTFVYPSWGRVSLRFEELLFEGNVGIIDDRVVDFCGSRVAMNLLLTRHSLQFSGILWLVELSDFHVSNTLIHHNARKLQ